MGFGIRRSKADALFSQYIRERDGWVCQRCQRQHEKNKNTLDNSHYWGRGWKSTRFDPENCDSLCKIPCHQLWGGEDREFYKAFKIKQLGKEGFDNLEIRAKTPKKVNEKEIEFALKIELDKIKSNKKVYKDYK